LPGKLRRGSFLGKQVVAHPWLLSTSQKWPRRPDLRQDRPFRGNIVWPTSQRTLRVVTDLLGGRRWLCGCGCEFVVLSNVVRRGRKGGLFGSKWTVSSMSFDKASVAMSVYPTVSVVVDIRKENASMDVSCLVESFQHSSCSIYEWTAACLIHGQHLLSS